MTQLPALRLGRWILQQYSDASITHLKLQKLSFYCYGAALAFDLETAIGTVAFEAWPHGPVSRELYNEYRAKGSTPLQRSYGVADFDGAVTPLLRTALRVYGRLTAWQLREQSHLEEPWIRANEGGVLELPAQSLKDFFRKKYATGSVECPEYVAQSWSLKLDGIPARGTYSSFEDLARAVSPSG